jgi:hypothetical protein
MQLNFVSTFWGKYQVDGQGSYKARKLESSMALKLQTSWLSNLSALSLQL